MNLRKRVRSDLLRAKRFIFRAERAATEDFAGEGVPFMGEVPSRNALEKRGFFAVCLATPRA
jgi:hypothetical protein